MEQKFVRVPFDLQLAKEITNGTKKGRIVTKQGRKVRIVCFDKKDENFNIVALVGDVGSENIVSYTLSGNYYKERETCDDLMLEIQEYMTFKDGDVVAFGSNSIGIFKGIDSCGNTFSSYATLCGNTLIYYEPAWRLVNARKATEEEKQKLIDKLKQSYDPRAKEYLKKLCIEEPKCNFKPFNKVLVRENDSCRWGIDFFMAYEEGFEPYKCMTGSWGECLPYNEGTEDLIGTTKSYNSK